MKKIQICMLVVSVSLILFFVLDKEPKNSLPKVEAGTIVDSPLLKTKIADITTESEGQQLSDSSKPEYNTKPIKQEEVTVERAFLVDGKGADLEFVKSIKDNDIFSTAINSLREDSVNNVVAQENKKYYERLALNIANENIISKEGYDFQMNDIQCGEKTCLFSATSNDDDMWESFVESLATPENDVYTLSHHSYIDDYGNIQHNVFMSVDESVNSFVSTEPIENITFSDGTVFNYEPEPELDGGG